MNKKVILNWLSLVALIATSAYVPVSAASLSTSTSSSADSSGLSEKASLAPEVQRGVLADSDDDDSDDQEDPDNPPTPEPPLDFPPPVAPVIPAVKPDLANPAEWSDRPLSTIIGFTFPSDISGGWTIPLEVAAFLDVQPPDSDGFTQVGMVAVSPEPAPPVPPVIGFASPFLTRNDNDDDDDNDAPTPTPDPVSFVSAMYSVEIDVVSTDDIVPGRLVSTTSTETIDVNFRRIPSIVNPDREEAIYPEFQLDFAPTSTASIASRSVCFVVSTTGGTFTRYCSINEASTPLSVRASFPTQYAELRNTMIAAAARIEYQAPLALHNSLSTIEDLQRIQDCANATDELTQQTACASDIIMAPVTGDYFNHKYNRKFGGGDGDDGNNGDDESADVNTVAFASSTDDDDGKDTDGQPGSGRTRIDIAVVRVLQPIEFATDDSSTTVIVQPGDYRWDVWFDVNGEFYAATFTGLTTDNILVTNQQVPAIPAIFVRESGPGEPFAQITGLCCKYFCLGESRR